MTKFIKVYCPADGKFLFIHVDRITRIEEEQPGMQLITDMYRNKYHPADGDLWPVPIEDTEEIYENG